jgi:hypothetical protein
MTSFPLLDPVVGLGGSQAWAHDFMDRKTKQAGGERTYKGGKAALSF